MSKTALPFAVDDIGSLARALRSRLLEAEGVPGHVELLNILARSTGCRNFQHFRANVLACETLRHVQAAPEPVDYVRLRRLLRHFDAHGRLVRWPPKFSEQRQCLWVLWAAMPARTALTEAAVNARLTEGHVFGDAALLRRELCDEGLMIRTPDCREYRRVEKRPPAEAVALIRRVREILGLTAAHDAGRQGGAA